jgi:predicted RNase H-like HicB family nuclease
MDGYTRVLHWSAEDGCFIVSVPELPGCMADGRTEIEALENINVIIREWIETAKIDGRPIPEPNRALADALC